MKKFLLILKGIFKSIGNWFAEETLFYIRFFKGKTDKASFNRIKKICDELTYKTGRVHFVFKDKELGKFVKLNWADSYSYNIIGSYICMCRKDYDFFSRQVVKDDVGRRFRALRKLSYIDIDKMTVYRSSINK